MRKIVINIIFLLAFIPSFSQNLVLNGDFENYSNCPVQRVFSYIMYYPPWYSANNLTPDSYNECSSSTIQFSVNIPNNYCGFQNAKQGKGYIGLWLNSPGLPNVGEYISGMLRNQLIKDSIYQISFFVSTADNSKHAVDRIGAYLSKDSIFQNNDNILPYKSQVESDSGFIIDYQTSWYEVKGLYKADGGEEYITIGSFHKSDSLNWKTYNPSTYIGEGAYYYIDSVTVILYQKPDTIIPPKDPQYTLFPNPATDEIKIEFKDIEPNSVEIELYDIIGRRIMIRQSNIIGSKYQADIRFLASGVYAYRLKVNGEFMGDGKLIVLK